MKNKILIGIITIFVFVFILFIRTDRGVEVEIKTIHEEHESYEIYVEYPQFKQVKRAFNNRIRDEVIRSIESFKGEVSRYDEVERESSDMFTYTGSWMSDQLNNEYISIIYRSSFYTGGAHGGRDIQTFTYDVRSKKELTIADLFLKQEDYLEKISRYVIQDLKKQLTLSEGREPNIEMITDGASPQIKNFSRFTVNRDGFVSLYFPEYQVAPYASGEQKVIIPPSFVETVKDNE